jgi:hypothetical protein
MLLNIKNKFDKLLRIIKPKIDLDLLVLVTGQACTLMCKDCGNFSPLLRRKFPFYTYKNLRKDLKILKRKISKIKMLQIQGGEFFLHSDAMKIIRYVQNSELFEKIVIATNGTIIPHDKILTLLQRPIINGGGGVTIRISNYSNVVDKSKLEKLKNKLTDFKINYELYNFAYSDAAWYDMGSSSKKNDYETMKKNFNICPFSGCLTLENGVISRCSRATVAHFVQKFEFDDDTRDGINIRKPFSTERLLYFVNSRQPVTSCYYCNLLGPKIQPAIQISQEN